MLKKKGNKVSESEGEESKESKKRANSEEAKQPKPKRIKNLYKQPTTFELNQLHETENLFNSNLFRLQINEVLDEVKVDEKTEKKIQTWFEKFKQYLLEIPENDNEYDLGVSTLKKELNVKIPIHKKMSKIKVAFKFHKFTDVSIVGSYKHECPIESKLCIDLAIKIPAETFCKNDSINYRYHKKYAYYLAIIASHLSKSDLITDLKYTYEDSETKALLSFKLEGKVGQHLNVKLRLFCDENAFKLSRFSPSRNNLRETWFFGKTGKEQVGPAATAYYNSSVLEDITHETNQKLIEEVLKNCDNLKQAIVLLKIWLKQRNLNVSGHIICLLIAYLVQIRRINNIMSSYQIIRNVWIYLSTSEWDKKGITLVKDSSSENPDIETFHTTFPVVFLDKTGFYNVCWKMQHGTYVALKKESSKAIQMLDNGQINSFIPLFMVTQKIQFQFDEIFRFKKTKIVKYEIYEKINETDKLNYGLEKTQLIVKKVYDILYKGLGNRCHLILFYPKQREFSWGVNENVKKVRSEWDEELRFGLCLNVEEAMNTIEKGPPANLPEAESFRAFWGEKSELRRFQDGSITETCVWEGDTISERRLVVKQIVLYLIKLKFGVESKVFYISNQLDSILRSKAYRPTGFEYGTGEEATVNLLKTFDSLRKDLRNLTDLPLQINSVSGVSPVFSYGDPLPPLPRESPDPARHWYRERCCLIKDGRDDGTRVVVPEYIKTSRAVIEFGQSGKWPGDLEAFRRLKAAFNIQIAENLSTQCSLVTHAFVDYVAVVKEGYVFRLEISHPKELNLMRRFVEDGVVKHRDTEQSIATHRDMVVLPKIRGALHGLHQSHITFGATVSLTKRWLCSHLIDSSHMPHVVVELLAASVFLRPEPYDVPGSPLRGLQAVLNLLSRSEWTSQPLFINFNQQLTKEEMAEIELQVSSDRTAYPPLVIVTPFDADRPALWSAAPSERVLARCQILARCALGYLERTLLNDRVENIMGMFKPVYCGYDVLIHLHPDMVPHRGDSAQHRPKLTPLNPGEQWTHVPVVDFSVVEKYLNELRAAYSEFALFFHNTYGGDVIAVLWRPELNCRLDFQVLRSNGMMPIGKQKCVINVPAMIDDFRILGRGIVRKIVV